MLSSDMILYISEYMDFPTILKFMKVDSKYRNVLQRTREVQLYHGCCDKNLSDFDIAFIAHKYGCTKLHNWKLKTVDKPMLNWLIHA